MRLAPAAVAFVVSAIPSLARAEGELGLGLGVKEVRGILLVSRVVPKSAASAASLEVGQRIARASGRRVATISELRRIFTDRRPGQELDLDIAEVEPEHRIGSIAFGSLLTGQASTESGWVGGYYSHALGIEFVSWVVALGYAAVGERPFYGRNVLGASFGVELAVPIVRRLYAVARGLACVNVPVGEGAVPGRWAIEPVGFAAQAGLRLAIIEVFFSGGLGPAKGANIGGGAALTFGFGGPSIDDPGESALL
jgi:hypothetical protein